MSNEGQTPEKMAEDIRFVQELKDEVNAFYMRLFHLNVGGRFHAFLEWCGVMGEHLNITNDMLKEGLPAFEMNRHSGHTPPIPGFRLTYMAEKMECIFDGLLEVSPKAKDKQPGDRPAFAKISVNEDQGTTTFSDGEQTAVLYWREGDISGSLKIDNGWYEIRSVYDRDVVEGLVLEALSHYSVRKAIDDLSQAARQVRELWDERHSTTNSKRYDELTQPLGAIRQAEVQRDHRAFILRVRLARQTGCTTEELVDLIR